MEMFYYVFLMWFWFVISVEGVGGSVLFPVATDVMDRWILESRPALGSVHQPCYYIHVSTCLTHHPFIHQSFDPVTRLSKDLTIHHSAGMVELGRD